MDVSDEAQWGRPVLPNSPGSALLQAQATLRSQWLQATEVCFPFTLHAHLPCPHGGHWKSPHGGSAPFSPPGPSLVTRVHECDGCGEETRKAVH